MPLVTYGYDMCRDLTSQDQPGRVSDRIIILSAPGNHHQVSKDAVALLNLPTAVAHVCRVYGPLPITTCLI